MIVNIKSPMSFAVINTKTVIGLVNSSDDFCDFISKKNPNAKVLDFKTIDDIKDDHSIEGGEYIIENDGGILLIKKTVTENKGWFSTSEDVNVEILDSWSLYDCTIDSDSDTESSGVSSVSSISSISNTSSDTESVNENEDNNKETDEHKLSNFSYDKIPDNPYILQIGKRGVGKTTRSIEIIDHMINSNKIKEENLTIFVRRPEYSKWIKRYPKASVHAEYKNKIIRQIMTQQRSNPKDSRYIVIEDGVLNRSAYESKLFTALMSKGRDLNIGFTIQIQYPMGFSVPHISMYDYVIIYTNNCLGDIKKTYEYYADVFPSFKSFYNCMMNSVTGNSALIIDNNKNKNTNRTVEDVAYILN